LNGWSRGKENERENDEWEERMIERERGRKKKKDQYIQARERERYS